jgi:hypothetical protein
MIMAKKQSRRSISLSRSTYERLRSYCETNGISMSQFVEHRVGDFLGRSVRPRAQTALDAAEAVPSAPQVASVPQVAVARPRPEPRPAPPPVVPTPDRIFTF